MRSYLYMLIASMVPSGDGDGGRIPLHAKGQICHTEDFNWVMISITSEPQREMSYLLKIHSLSPP